MSKRRKTFSLDEDVEGELSAREHMNASSVVNELLRQYLFQGESQDAALQMRKRDLDREIEETRKEISHLKSKLERLQDEKEQVKDQIQARRREGLKEVGQFIERVVEDRTDSFDLSPENAAVQNYAQKANMTPERFVEKVEDQL